MQLHFKRTGKGKPVIILHGLFGSGDNWATFGKNLSENNCEVYLTDLRNHGHSPWDDDHSYHAMSNDLFEMINANDIEKPVILGHSMGGKAAMQFAVEHPETAASLIIVDIAPYYYPQHHQKIFQALLSVDLNTVTTRAEADEQISIYIKDVSTKQFLLKNLYWKGSDKLAWRFNLHALNNKIENVGEAITGSETFLPALFVRGENSTYIQENDLVPITKIFPNADLITIPGAGHWIHADQPDALMAEVISFLDQDPQ